MIISTLGHHCFNSHHNQKNLTPSTPTVQHDGGCRHDCMHTERHDGGGTTTVARCPPYGMSYYASSTTGDDAHGRLNSREAPKLKQ